MHKIEFIDKALLIDNEILVIADFHLGYEERLAEKGIFVPKIGFKETLKDLDRIFKILYLKKTKIREIVILGDIKHDFKGYEAREADNVIKILNYLTSKLKNFDSDQKSDNKKISDKQKCKKIIVIKGNHDNYILSLLKKENIKLVNGYKREDILFMHGDVEIKIEKQVKLIVLGHMHPAVVLKDNHKKEKFKCFLRGKYKDKEVIILPSFFPLYEGANVLVDKGKFLSLDLNIKNFDIYIIGDKEVLRFGKVRDL